MPEGQREFHATTRELPLDSPARPIATPMLLLAQVLLVVAGLAMLPAAMNIGLGLLALALIMTPFTAHGWRWWVKYPKARLLTTKKLATLTPGTWIVRPGNKYAVVIRDEPQGAEANPTIADELTREELAIIAPVYSFREPPKHSRMS